MQAVAGLRLRLYGVTELYIAPLRPEDSFDAQLCLFGPISADTPNHWTPRCTLSQAGWSVPIS